MNRTEPSPVFSEPEWHEVQLLKFGALCAYPALGPEEFANKNDKKIDATM